MSKKRIQNQAASLTRADLVDIVGEIAAAQIKHDKTVAQMNTEIDAARARHQEQVEALQATIKEKSLIAEAWARAHPDQFDKTRSIDFGRGIVGFRTGQPTLKALKGWTLKDVLAALKRLAWGKNFVRIREEIAKDELIAARKTITDAMAAKAGFEFVQEERFFVEPKLDDPVPAETSP